MPLIVLLSIYIVIVLIFVKLYYYCNNITFIYIHVYYFIPFVYNNKNIKINKHSMQNHTKRQHKESEPL